MFKLLWVCRKQEWLWFKQVPAAVMAIQAVPDSCCMCIQYRKVLKWKVALYVSEQEDALECPPFGHVFRREIRMRLYCMENIAWLIWNSRVDEEQWVIGLMNCCFFWWTLLFGTFALSNSWTRTIVRSWRVQSLIWKR